MNNLIRIFLPLMFVAGLVGCNTAAPIPAAGPTQLPVPTATPTAGAQGACANSLYPVVEGATWTYAGTGGPAGSYAFTDTITVVRPDGFTLTSVFNNEVTRTQEWICKPEGLVAMQLPGVAGSLTANQFQAQFEASDIRGITLPASVSPGEKWPFGLNIKGTLTAGSTTAQADGDAGFAFQAISLESISVPAGTFNAMKIDTVLTLDFTATVSGLSVPLKLILNGASWYAPGIGMVKTVARGDLAGQSFSDTLELQSYSIP